MLAGVGCKDYDDDIDKINDRLDELTTGKIATLESQLGSLQTAVDNLKSAVKLSENGSTNSRVTQTPMPRISRLWKRHRINSRRTSTPSKRIFRTIMLRRVI